MKQLLTISILALAIVMGGCKKISGVAQGGKEECIIQINTRGIQYSDLPQKKSTTSGNLLAVQIYEVEGEEETPYAVGLFDSWEFLSFKGYTQTSYKFKSTMIIAAKEKLQSTDGVYGKPFDRAALNEFAYTLDEMTSIDQSTATLADGRIWATPSLDRYYGMEQASITPDQRKITIQMRRVSFGVRIDGIDESEEITLKIVGAPEVTTHAAETTLFTFNYITKAYEAYGSDTPYEETIRGEILRNGAVIYSGALNFRRNQLTTITVTDQGVTFGFDFEKPFEDGLEPEVTPPAADATPYITKVFDYMPAPGQFVNELPLYEVGDKQEDMNAKVLAAIGNNNEKMITLGSYGGYVTVGFDHTIMNVEGKRDFRIIGNAFYSAANPDENNYEGGSCEAGIVMVAYDKNKNKKPDDDEWYEIEGSSHVDVTAEPWYQKALDNGNDVNFYYNDFSLTYTRPTSEPSSEEESASYIPWTDNKGNSGHIAKNGYHKQCYYPEWIAESTLTFTGSRLPQNAIDESGKGTYFVLYKFQYGYADNEKNSLDDASIDIEWAIDANGNRVSLPGVDFIRVYNGVNQVNGWLGESSTEITNIEDLHLLGESIDTIE